MRSQDLSTLNRQSPAEAVGLKDSPFINLPVIVCSVLAPSSTINRPPPPPPSPPLPPKYPSTSSFWRHQQEDHIDKAFRINAKLLGVPKLSIHQYPSTDLCVITTINFCPWPFPYIAYPLLFCPGNQHPTLIVEMYSALHENHHYKHHHTHSTTPTENNNPPRMARDRKPETRDRFPGRIWGFCVQDIRVGL